jgi:hypothetical protein
MGPIGEFPIPPILLGGGGEEPLESFLVEGEAKVESILPI